MELGGGAPGPGRPVLEQEGIQALQQSGERPGPWAGPGAGSGGNARPEAVGGVWGAGSLVRGPGLWS